MLSNPQMFNGFIDILKLPSVRSTLSRTLSNNYDSSGESEDPQKRRRQEALIRTLELFAYGTVGEYYDLMAATTTHECESSSKVVWTLNEVMLEKLRMLTVVSVVTNASRIGNEGNGALGGGKKGGAERYDEKCPAGDVEMKMADAALSERNHIAQHSMKQSMVGARKGKYSRHGDRKKSSKVDNGGLLSIPYSLLASELRMPYHQTGSANDNTVTDDDDDKKKQHTKHIRQLEDLLIKCIYSNIISAKLDQLTQCLIVQPHVMLDSANGGGDFVGWETFFAGASSSDDGEGVGMSGGGGGGGGGAGGVGCVYGSVLSRDLHTITPESTTAEITRMSSTLQQFLLRSNALLSTLERLSDAAIVKHRKDDERRWDEVRKVVDDAPSRMNRDMGSPSMQSAFPSSSMAAAAGGDQRSMRVGWGRGGASDGGSSGNLMEVVDMMGARRQVKRSKGGHSMVGV